jgi:hypothetical protein
MEDRAAHEWSGEEWQEYCEQLLILRHPNAFARMPDTDGGDLGLEGYATDGTGCGYQCYVTEQQETGKRADAQKRKITRDLKKLCDGAVEVARHLGDVVLLKWILVVPIHDSKAVTRHAREKELEMRGKGLLFIDPSFRVDIQTALTHFAAERNILEQAGAGLVRAPMIDVAPEELERFAKEEPELTRNLTEKIARLVAGQGEERQRDLVDFMQLAAVRGANIEDLLRVQHAPVYETYLRERSAEENDVKLEASAGTATEPRYVVDVRRRFEERLVERVRALGSHEANLLSHGAVADWLRRCPMDFPEP